MALEEERHAGTAIFLALGLQLIEVLIAQRSIRISMITQPAAVGLLPEKWRFQHASFLSVSQKYEMNLRSVNNSLMVESYEESGCGA